MGLKNNVKNSVSADCQYHSEIGNQFKYNSSEMKENGQFFKHQIGKPDRSYKKYTRNLKHTETVYEILQRKYITDANSIEMNVKHLIQIVV